jgi:hypothetical protein
MIGNGILVAATRNALIPHSGVHDMNPTVTCPESDQDQQPPRTASLRATVVTVLRSSGYRPLWNLRCDVNEDGVVTLTGTLPSYHLKQIAQTGILRLAEVRRVRNLVEVRRAEYRAGE